MLEQLEDNDFSIQCKLIFKVIKQLRDQGLPSNRTAIHQLLKMRGELELAGGVEFLAYLTNLFPIVEDIHAYIYMTKQEAVKFRGGEIIDQAQFTLRNSAEAPIDVLTNTISRLQKETVKIKPVGGTKIEHEEIEQRWEKQAHYINNVDEYPSWPIRALPPMNRDLFTGRLIVFGGAMGSGKSTIMLKTAMVNAARGFPMEFISFEMGKADLYNRMYMYYTGKDLLAQSREVRKEHLAAMTKLPLRIHTSDEGYDNKDKLFSALHTMKYEGAITVFIDYLGLIKINRRGNMNLAEAIGEVTTELSRIARKIDLCIVLGCQYNRSVGAGNKAPTVYDLRDSGHIENDGHDVILVDRPEQREKRHEGDTNMPSHDRVVWAHAKCRSGSSYTTEIMWSQQYNSPKFDHEWKL